MEHVSRSTFGSSSSSSSPAVRVPMENRQNPQTGIAISKIEDILAVNIDALRATQPMTIPLRSRRTGRVQAVRFPSNRDTEARKFTSLLLILHLSHEALVAGRVITKRAIYYQNPELFGTQRYVDELVDDIAFTFGLGRDALNIVATRKGLIAGAINVTISNRTVLCCNADDGQDILIPDTGTITDIKIGVIKWLLVIEKEVDTANLTLASTDDLTDRPFVPKATFRGLVASGFHQTAVVGPGILITAKGYPDLATRQFLHKLHAEFPTLPMYGLVDFDPDGMKIMLTYKNGSRSLEHEENTTLDRLSWIGPKSSDILGNSDRNLPPIESNSIHISGDLPSHQVSSSIANQSPNHSSPIDAMLPLKATDRRLAVHILSAMALNHNPGIEDVEFIRELQIMLLFNFKAEIQAVDEAGDLTEWLDKALTKQMDGR